MTNTERVTLLRRRKKLGQRPVTVIVSEQEIDFLLAHHYELSRKDADSIGAGGIAVPLRFSAVHYFSQNLAVRMLSTRSTVR